MLTRKLITKFRISSFSSSTIKQDGFGSHVSDNDPEVLEREKQKSLDARKHPEAGLNGGRGLKNAPGWNERLASDSEAIVKAELEPEEDPKTLQQETIEFLKKQE
jgi:hypothetical protein